MTHTESQGYSFWEEKLHGFVRISAAAPKLPRLAGTILAAMNRTDATGLLKALFEGQAGTMPANLEVVRPDVQLPGELIWITKLELEAVDQLCIPRFQRGQQFTETLA